MNDSTEDQKEATNGLLRTINLTLKDFFDVRRQRAELKLKHEKKQAKLADNHQKKDEPLATLEAELTDTLRALIIPNELVLMTGKLRSFATVFGKISFKKKPESTKVANPAGFEATARKDGTLTTLGSFTRTWKPSKIKEILAWMAANPKRAKKYQQFIEKSGGYDELFVKPNDPYLTNYDPDRLTVESVNLGEAKISQDERSPDA